MSARPRAVRATYLTSLAVGCFVMTAGVAVAAPGSPGSGWADDPAMWGKPDLQEIFGQKRLATMQNAVRVDAFRVSSERWGFRIHDPVRADFADLLGLAPTATRLDLPADLVARIKAVFLNPQSYRVPRPGWGMSICGGFRPGVVFRFSPAAGPPIDAFLCFECNELVMIRYPRDRSTARVHPGRRAFLEIAAAAFPDDAVLGPLLRSAQQTPAGTWKGHWEREGEKLPIEVTFTPWGTTRFTATFSSLPLRAMGVPLANVHQEERGMVWGLAGDETSTHFQGVLVDDRLTGNCSDNGSPRGTFTLARVQPSAATVRDEPVTFASGGVKLAGTIVSPAGPGKFPGVAFLHGSGAEGRWASRYLAEAFARAGIVALITDKRGVGESTGDWRAAGFRELVADAAAAVDVLRTRPNVDADRVGIHGHSQGGTIAPWVASENPHLAFVIASAPAGVGMAETEIFSLGNSVGLAALPPDQQPLAERYVRAVVATAYEGAPRSALDRAWKQARGHSWAFPPPPPTDFYWALSRRIAAYDPSRFWQQVKVPTLLLFGENDQRVPAARSAAAITTAYARGNGRKPDIITFAGGDHSFRCGKAAPDKFTWPHDCAGYPAQIVAWVLQR